MKRIFLALLSASGLALASNPTVLIQDLNFEYQDPTGHGSAANFSVSGLKNAGVTVDVEKVGKDFNFNVQGAAEGQYVFKNAPDLLSSAQSMDITGFNLTFEKALKISIGSGEFISPDQELSLQKINLDCSRDQNQTDVADQAILGCIKLLILKASRFTTQSFIEENFVTAFVAGMTGLNGASVGINNLNMKVTNGQYDLSADVKAQVSGKAKSLGNLSYDSTNKVLTIKISEVKFSILNVTNQVFDELKKNENPKMKVSKPYVYLTLK